LAVDRISRKNSPGRSDVRKTKWKALAASVLIAAVTYMTWPRPARVTPANCLQVRYAARLADVEAVVGPPGDYRLGPTRPASPYAGWSESRPGSAGSGQTLVWKGDAAMLTATVGRDGSVLTLSYRPAERIGGGPGMDLAWLAVRLWDRWFDPGADDEFVD
jgi:hypothetical protein